jgi:hypothetical protein
MCGTGSYCRTELRWPLTVNRVPVVALTERVLVTSADLERNWQKFDR